MEHLLPHVATIAIQSNDERIKHIKSRWWIPYPKATEYLKVFHGFVSNPIDDRMENALLIGRPNNGKTHLLREFERPYVPKPVYNVGTKLEVLYVQAPPRANEAKFYNAILKGLNAPFGINDKVDKKYYKVLEWIEKVQLRVLIIDEIHNIISATYSKQRDFLMNLKAMSNDLRISLICSGNHEAERVMANDSQMTSRFPPLVLDDWRIDNENDAKSFLTLLATFNQLLPLKESTDIKSLAPKIHKMGEGLIGEYSTILKKSAIYSIENNLEVITEDILGKISFIPPSLRGRTKFDR